MGLGLITLVLPAAAIAFGQKFAGQSPCTKLLLLSVVLFALALCLRALLRHVSSPHRLPARCEFSETGVKTP